MMSSGHSRGCVKSILASPSAESDGWIDLTLIMTGMIQELGNEAGMMSSGHSRGCLKSIQASPSAEGDGWIDLTLRMIVMSTFLNDDQMTG